MPEDVLPKDAALPEDAESHSEPISLTSTMVGETDPSPYDRWRNYQPASLARPESADPLDLLSEPVSPLGSSILPSPAERGQSEAVLVDETLPHSLPVAEAIASVAAGAVRHSPFVADDEIRAVQTGGLKSDLLHAEPPNPVSMSAATVNASGVDIAPSRKLDTPDMLRWRAEMLLDEMMVGAVDTSAGEGGGGWRSSAYSEASMLDDHPRRDARPEPASQISPSMPITDGNGIPQTSEFSTEPSTLAVDATLSAGVRAALPPRTVTRMPTPILRNATAAPDATATRDAENPFDANGAQSNGYASRDEMTGGAADNGYNGNHVAGANTGNGAPYRIGNGLNGPNGALANGHTGYSLDPLEHEIADDGRPTYGVPTAEEWDTQRAVARPVQQPSIDPLDSLGSDMPAASNGYTTSLSTAAVEPQRRTPTRTSGGSVSTVPPAAPIPGTSDSTYTQPRRIDSVSASEQRAASEQTARKLTAVEQRYPRPAPPDARGQDIGVHTPSAYAPGAYAPSGAHNDGAAGTTDTYTSGLGPVRINPAVLNSASVAGAMSVGSRAHSRYASLLPRATPWDLHEMEREILSLQEEMARVMPSGHESSRRAHHLLEKAQSIFNGDPLRSAEVDYYLTQVRAIVQRSRQTMQWSESYRKQLIRYHQAWIALSGLMLVLGLIFGNWLAEWVVSFLGLNPAGLIAAYSVPAMIAMFAGSLGGSIGALLNIRRYHRLDLGYFDRKYSLRGLVLPIIGMLGGLAFAAVFGSLYWVMGTAAPLPIVLELLPAVLAFALGFLQESIYGTRD